MNKYSYPAVFTPEKNGAYSVIFPDLESCYTCGDDLTDAIMMAEDVLAYTLYDYERESKDIPVPSPINSISTSGDEFVSYVACDTLEYRKMHNSKAVKKTLTIPEWLNEEATALGINFSQVLQEALLSKIQV
ncbi:MAG: type II toxin-antitoxin system HicB family antitoxin [Lachnospiraceae bacterium]|nr:type II toxin-antitoxin system HicB family antitoxin [Lachnospiraceae bacterium]MBO5144378.1 type II toxin-antitoxin system HicB family antitoxin [Lachnospiraceae bacterium]